MSPPSAARRRAGFTMIEMMAVVLLTSIILMGAVDLYVQLASSTTAAAETTRTQRRAVLLLDRVARDLEGAVLLVRPDEVDPLEWPWLFLAENELRGDTADRLKLDTRGAPPPTGDDAGDLAVVAWWTETGPDDLLELYRWSAREQPESLDRRFPDAEDADTRLVAEDVVHFGVRLLDEEGAWHEAWDSSTLTWSNQLPVGAEIQLALEPSRARADGEAPVYTRLVRIPVRPLDLAALQAGEEEGEGGEEGEEGEEDEEGEESAGRDDANCVTVAECRQRNPGAFEAFLSGRPDRASIEQVLDSMGDQCVSDHAGSLPFAVQGCQ